MSMKSPLSFSRRRNGRLSVALRGAVRAFCGAFGAYPQEFHAMPERLESVFLEDRVLAPLNGFIEELDDLSAAFAVQMVVVAVPERVLEGPGSVVLARFPREARVGQEPQRPEYGGLSYAGVDFSRFNEEGIRGDMLFDGQERLEHRFSGFRHFLAALPEESFHYRFFRTNHAPLHILIESC
jgi:hypothetical protein